jgi:hypothetical protein
MRTVARMLLPSTSEPTICARRSVDSRFILTIMLEQPTERKVANEIFVFRACVTRNTSLRLRPMADPVVEILSKQSAARLREMLESADKQISDLRVQREWITRALESKGAAPASTQHEQSAPALGRKRGSKRTLIQEILAADPQRVWIPADVRTALAERGHEASIESVRITLRRMAADREVIREPNGWKLASANGSTQEPLTEVPNLGPEGYGR